MEEPVVCRCARTTHSAARLVDWDVLKKVQLNHVTSHKTLDVLGLLVDVSPMINLYIVVRITRLNHDDQLYILIGTSRIAEIRKRLIKKIGSLILFRKMELRQFSRFLLLCNTRNTCIVRYMEPKTVIEERTLTITTVVSSEAVILNHTILFCSLYERFKVSIGDRISIINGHEVGKLSGMSGIDAIAGCSRTIIRYCSYSREDSQSDPRCKIKPVFGNKCSLMNRIALYLALLEMKQKFPKFSTQKWLKSYEFRTLVIGSEAFNATIQPKKTMLRDFINHSNCSVSTRTSENCVPALKDIFAIWKKNSCSLETCIVIGLLRSSRSRCGLQLIDKTGVVNVIPSLKSRNSEAIRLVSQCIDDDQSVLLIYPGAIEFVSGLIDGSEPIITITVNLDKARVICVNPKSQILHQTSKMHIRFRIVRLLDISQETGAEICISHANSGQICELHVPRTSMWICAFLLGLPHGSIVDTHICIENNILEMYISEDTSFAIISSQCNTKFATEEHFQLDLTPLLAMELHTNRFAHIGVVWETVVLKLTNYQFLQQDRRLAKIVKFAHHTAVMVRIDGISCILGPVQLFLFGINRNLETALCQLSIGVVMEIVGIHKVLSANRGLELILVGIEGEFSFHTSQYKEVVYQDVFPLQHFEIDSSQLSKKAEIHVDLILRRVRCYISDIVTLELLCMESNTLSGYAKFIAQDASTSFYLVAEDDVLMEILNLTTEEQNRIARLCKSLHVPLNLKTLENHESSFTIVKRLNKLCDLHPVNIIVKRVFTSEEINRILPILLSEPTFAELLLSVGGIEHISHGESRVCRPIETYEIQQNQTYSSRAAAWELYDSLQSQSISSIHV